MCAPGQPQVQMPVWVAHTQMWGWNHSWAPGTMQLRKKSWSLSSQLHKPQITHTPARHILIKLTKIKYKEKILKATREKQQITYKGIPIRLSANFSAETLQARREWYSIFKEMKGKNLQPRILYPARLSFIFNREIKSFSDKQKLKEFSTTKPAIK